MLKVKAFLFLCFCSSVSGDILELSKLQYLSSELRQGDRRIIRPNPTDETAAIQRELCPDAILSVVQSLIRSRELPVRSEAAEVLHLCTTNNPKNRADIGSVENSVVHTGLTNLIDTSMTYYNDRLSTEEKREAANAISRAAEAVWILAFNNERNQQRFLDAGVVDSLVKVLLNCHVRDFGELSVCSRAVMWSLAALQNLAATYCHTEDGRCDWVLNEADKLVLSENSTPTSDVGSHVRQKLKGYLEHSNLALLLKFFVCNGAGNWSDSASSLSEQDYESRHQNPFLIPWASAGLIQNLALSSEIYDFWEDEEELFECLCYMHRNSQDSLEFDKSTAALYYLAWLGFCSDDAYWCVDFEDWFEPKTGNNCTTIEEDSMCDLIDKDGVSAIRACCICGGGVPPYSDI